MTERQYFLSADLADRFAALDVGTNSVRLIIAEPRSDGTYRVLDDERESTRLGARLSSSHRLDPQAIQRTLDALKRMQQICEGYQVQHLRVIATSAVREAEDGPEFCRRVFAETGLEVEVISAETEARLAFFGVMRSLDLEGKQVAVVDIGGGSTEIVLASGNIVDTIYTTKLGAVRLSERHAGTHSAHALVEDIDRTLDKALKRPPFTPHLLIGTGGTFTTLAAIIMAEKGQQGLPVRGYQVTRAELRHTLDRLTKMTSKARRNVPGLAPERADIIVAGLSIIDRIMRHFKLNVLQVHSGGVRDGLLLTMVDRSLGEPSQDPHDRQAAIERFATACGVDLKHARHVARLAGSIHAQLAEAYDLDPNDRPLLEAAAQLQDVGYLINYDGHHKHSYHLILNSRLAGFRPRELELIANVARYHRGADPKKKHANFQQLNDADRRRVRQMAAILRVASGFDRSHRQIVEGVSVGARSKRVEMLAQAPENPEVDLWGVRRRAPLFEKIFGVELGVTWAGSDNGTSNKNAKPNDREQATASSSSSARRA